MKTEDEKTKLGTVLVRGDTILLASPVNEWGV
jgi:small nuclear ribonucleoprotein (snRNP)-like protein